MKRRGWRRNLTEHEHGYTRILPGGLKLDVWLGNYAWWGCVDGGASIRASTSGAVARKLEQKGLKILLRAVEKLKADVAR